MAICSGLFNHFKVQAEGAVYNKMVCNGLQICFCVSLWVQMQRELNTHPGEGTDVRESSSGHRGVFSPQDSPCHAPRSPRSPRSPCASTTVPNPPTRSHSDSEAMLEGQGAAMRLKCPTENLFLDALSLDPLSGLEVPAPCRLESEKRFPCMEEVTHTLVKSGHVTFM